MRIGILSDTHGLLRPEVLACVGSCDAIVHAGDLNTPDIVERLSDIAPLYVVRGNNDREWAEHIPVSLRFTLGGLRFYMVHDKADIADEPKQVDVVVFGHSHSYVQEERCGCLWLNPGSCGSRRFRLPVTMAVLTVESLKYTVERIVFSDEG